MREVITRIEKSQTEVGFMDIKPAKKIYAMWDGPTIYVLHQSGGDQQWAFCSLRDTTKIFKASYPSAELAIRNVYRVWEFNSQVEFLSWALASLRCFYTETDSGKEQRLKDIKELEEDKNWDMRDFSKDPAMINAMAQDAEHLRVIDDFRKEYEF